MSTPTRSPDESNTSPSTAARIGLWLGPLWVVMVLTLPAPAGMSEPAWACAGLALLMATWWATEAIPIPATALLPLLLVPALGIGELSAAAPSYANPIIFLFLGGFLLGIGMQRWNLHRRIALKVLQVVGPQPRRQVAGFMLATGFLSMWVSNTATSIMMLPIGMSVISLLEDSDPKELNRYATALLLAIAYSASIGGIATLIGTPPNALLAGYLADDRGIDIGFAQWMLVGVPVSVVMMVAAWWWLTRGGFALGDNKDSASMIRDELSQLGHMSPAEQRVGIVFLLAALSWVFRPVINDLGIAWLSDTGIAIAAGLLLFLLPSGNTPGVRLLDWDEAKELPWGVLLLFGGGLALAGVIKSSGLAEWIANQLSLFEALPLIALIGMVVLVIIFLTELTSNTATAAAFLPLLGALALSMDVSPVLITVPAAIAASCAFMMPVATPPNAIVFATGHMRIQSMISAGFLLNLVGSVVVTGLAYLLVTTLW
ncbi:solute carrier family 13 (sodium-dependent dicarboxylate transporter), member 2/3/5 [Modicisalibacter ilicicola DSM 19980]|uniref:Solute carrier family 13 (Sodium-dependent dicarboxylate transporter), member 2/3/5 n=1 Tax=Modicisalibacter ilicicola DSM 19980 TaxID=1121942 RepID=A0A1M4X8U0_9GAMM|nr:DASS family sodium-coupled anion symporter [Halomonas ilicicola]SHE89562.1 solute carrier family 13 (sodium-dependent dicarboxylate transporter), member 2/3/5 [Halomonas ilicicola DSM 19980]